jgi:hypothetical protein
LALLFDFHHDPPRIFEHEFNDVLTDHLSLQDGNSGYPVYSLPLELIKMAIPPETIRIDVFLYGLDGNKQLQSSILKHGVLFEGAVEELRVVDQVAAEEFDLLYCELVGVD